MLLDINLPSYDGYYWCRQLRQHTTCPIIFISARSGEMDQIFALENGGDDFITKPFNYEIVLAKIRSHLRRTYGEYAATQEERTVEVRTADTLFRTNGVTFKRFSNSTTKERMHHFRIVNGKSTESCDT